jgi:hypothetical protein
MSQIKPASTSTSLLDQASETHTDTTGRQQWKFLVRVVLLVLLVVLTYQFVRIGLHGVAMYNSLSELRAAIGHDLSADSLASVQPAVDQTALSAAALEREMRLFAPVLRAAHVLPGVGPTIAAVPSLLSAGREYTFIASEGLRLVGDEQAGLPDAPVAQVLLQTVANNRETFAIFAERASHARQSLDTINASELMPQLADPVAELQSVAVLAEAGFSLAPYAPEMMGFDGPRRYLVLVQNNHELRATGGFISALGLVTAENGELGKLALTDSYNVQRDDVDHPWAPEAMRDYMGIDLVFLRDANWSPDLPTTGRLARALYSQDAGEVVDGVITVDLRAVELLVGALGPLNVQGSQEPVTGENLVEQIKKFWDQPIATGDSMQTAGMEEWWKQRKDFMPALAQAALNRISSGNFDPLDVAAAIETALDERAIQVWIAEPEVDDIFAAHDWDGALKPVEGADLVALVDTNMGYNKVDSVLHRSLDHSVSWPDGADSPAVAETVITYRHPIEVPGHVCDQTPRYGDNYDAMTERCYFDYVRLYVPGGSELISAEGVSPDSVEASMGENGTTVLSGFFEMLPGSEHEVRFTYRLPSDISADTYRLEIRKQAGSGPLPVNASADGHTLATEVTEGHFLWDPGNE